jgi:hypothetical protein
MKMKKKKYKKYLKEGSALLLSLFIITSIVIIAMGGSSLALSGIKMAGVQSQSVKAYFAAEAGAEELLYRTRRDKTIDLSGDVGEVVVLETQLDNEAEYWVVFTQAPDFISGETIFTSLGSYFNTRRSVDLRF